MRLSPLQAARFAEATAKFTDPVTPARLHSVLAPRRARDHFFARIALKPRLAVALAHVALAVVGAVERAETAVERGTIWAGAPQVAVALAENTQAGLRAVAGAPRRLRAARAAPGCDRDVGARGFDAGS